ncbi:DUF769 domain-containing protein [Chitinimonas naiadis]
MRQITLGLALAACLLAAGCASTTSNSAAPVVKVYTPRWAIYDFVLNGRYHIHHEYFAFGTSREPIARGGCGYALDDDRAGPMYERDGRLYQDGINAKGPSTMSMDRYAVGMRRKGMLGGLIDKTTGIKGETVHFDYNQFAPLCSDRVGSSDYSVYLQAAKVLTIEQDAQAEQQLLDRAYKGYSKWEPLVTEARGGSRWRVSRTWNYLDYLSDSTEYWYLPIGESGYYYKVGFTYKSVDLKNGPAEQYLRSRQAFEHILDSFEITEVAKAAR